MDMASTWSWVTNRKVAPSFVCRSFSSARRSLAQLRVEVGQRLVHQEDARLAHDGAADRDALHLAAGEAVRLAVEEVVDANVLAARATRSSISGWGIVADRRLQRKFEVLRAP